MPLSLVTIPCLADNYAYLIHDAETGETALIDAPEPGPILAALAERGWKLTDVILTHHHWDHIDGLPPIVEAFAPRVIGAAADAHRLPHLDLAVRDGDAVTVCGETAQVFDVSGHTVGHIAVHFPASGLVFTADSLMALGCGRLFEGTAAQMWDSLLKLRALPDSTTVCSGHEYTLGNARFALTVDPDNVALQLRTAAIEEARDEGRPTVPTTLGEEKATNPFLRADAPDLQAAIGMVGADPADVFAEVRTRKDNF
ncbi:hydroxyacylglutathione hydrolase [Loktanella sp. IMCC34160]|uniref:hydroxyacylglutathione hydrolase n=1 Tax=Loktanella sp. IMCC34160 TaxID=2510646 RepID=UPI00101C8203|nr:hydroxyacylglutathione hydrolase [Loktanella sp. IMCC34160]RYG91848.1 hydroxyacylglutathione hydrolase [Loktanella sp. IMCC34160]